MIWSCCSVSDAVAETAWVGAVAATPLENVMAARLVGTIALSVAMPLAPVLALPTERPASEKSTWMPISGAPSARAMAVSVAARPRIPFTEATVIVAVPVTVSGEVAPEGKWLNSPA